MFDLLVAQTYGLVQGSHRDRHGARRSSATPTAIRSLDDAGNPIPLPINVNAKRFLFAEDPDVKFGSLDETPLGGFIDSIDMSIRHLSAISQTPPHHLLGQIANLSAEALLAAETALSARSRSSARASASPGSASSVSLPSCPATPAPRTTTRARSSGATWRSKSLAQAADALGKLAEALQIPKRGLWARVPGVTANEIREWEELREDEDGELLLAQSLRRATPDPAERLRGDERGARGRGRRRLGRVPHRAHPGRRRDRRGRHQALAGRATHAGGRHQRRLAHTRYLARA